MGAVRYQAENPYTTANKKFDDYDYYGGVTDFAGTALENADVVTAEGLYGDVMRYCIEFARKPAIENLHHKGYYYAQLNDDGVCVGMADLSGEVVAPNMIRLESFDVPLLGKRYSSETGEFIDEGEGAAQL